MYATAVWDGLLPRRLLEQGLTTAVHRLQHSGNPWASVRGPFSACAATALRLGLVIQGFVWRHAVLGEISVLDFGPRS
eukprot:8298585-Pyramimonas_sp.AAC.1